MIVMFENCEVVLTVVETVSTEGAYDAVVGQLVQFTGCCPTLTVAAKCCFSQGNSAGGVV